MGMSIEEAIEIISDIDKAYRTFSNMEYKAMQKSIDVMRKYQMMQADYNARLKADMVEMLEELKEQLRETHEDFFETEHFDEAYGVSDSMDIIQQKINSLRGAEHE